MHLCAGLIDAAVVGGVYLNLDCVNPVCFSRIGALSPSDRCRPFDASGDGFVLGEGAGVVVLKRMDDAIEDGDRIRGVIRGIALNNDGRAEGPMTPRALGQATVLRRAYRDAGVAPDAVGLLEAHGTATVSGDQVEIAALKEAFESERSRPIDCAIGSVKANIGHTLAAAGVAGLIKAALALEHGIIPPQAGFDTPRPELGLDKSGFWIPREEHSWPVRADHSRFAAVSAFGFGGTNVHVVLEAPPVSARVPIGHISSGLDGSWPHAEPFLIAAPTPDQLSVHLGNLESAIRDLDGRASLADIAYTLSATRRHDRLRVAFTAASHTELLDKLARARAACAVRLTVATGLWIGSAVPETARTELPASPRRDNDQLSVRALETWCRRPSPARNPTPPLGSRVVTSVRSVSRTRHWRLANSGRSGVVAARTRPGRSRHPFSISHRHRKPPMRCRRPSRPRSRRLSPLTPARSELGSSRPLPTPVRTLPSGCGTISSSWLTWALIH